MVQSGFGAIEREFDGVSLGDMRLDERLRRIVELSSTSPEDSFPEQMRTVADREGLYRFFSNRKVTLDGLLKGHVRHTHTSAFVVIRAFVSSTIRRRFTSPESERDSASRGEERAVFSVTSQ